MHIDYAAESFKSMTQPRYAEPLTNRQVVECNVTYPEFLALADAIGNEKISSIVATIRKSAGNKFAKTTSAQKFTLAMALLDAHTTPAAVYAAALGVTEDEFLAAVAAA